MEKLVKVTKTEKEISKHFARCYEDFPYYARNNLKVRTKPGKLVNFNLNEVQLAVEEIEKDIINSGRLIRIYILKARQEGISTWSTGKFFWKVTTSSNKSAVIVTHEPAATRNLFDMQKRYYKHLEPEFKPQDKRNNVKLLQFNNDDDTGLDSSIGVATAGVKDFGSSQTINFLHISELAKWPRENESDLLLSLFQCVPRVKDSAVIIESTAKGASGEFYKGFNACRFQYTLYCENKKVKWKMTINENASKASSYSSIFIPWFVLSEYREPVDKDFLLTKEEEIISKKFYLDNEQLSWYRSILVDECKRDENKRDQEYPMTAKSAFVGSGSPAFNIHRVTKLMQDCIDPILIYKYNYSLNRLMEDIDGDIKIWKQPEAGVPYLISADVAEGLSHGDFNSATIWNHKNMSQVGSYHGHIMPMMFAKLLNFLGRMYNNAWLVPERNNHGISVIEKLLELNYPNIYMEMIEDPPHKPRHRFGWLTSKKARILILDNLINDVYEGTCKIKDKETFNEMLNFKIQADGKVEADSGEFDDRVIDVAIGRYAMNTLDYVISFNRQRLNTVSSNAAALYMPHTQQEPNPLAWN